MLTCLRVCLLVVLLQCPPGAYLFEGVLARGTLLQCHLVLTCPRVCLLVVAFCNAHLLLTSPMVCLLVVFLFAMPTCCVPVRGCACSWSFCNAHLVLTSLRVCLLVVFLFAMPTCCVPVQECACSWYSFLQCPPGAHQSDGVLTCDLCGLCSGCTAGLRRSLLACRLFARWRRRQLLLADCQGGEGYAEGGSHEVG